jgi:hypothetical protein
MWTLEKRVLKFIDPPPEICRRVVGLSFVRPLGNLMALDELLRAATDE